jgi:hypothetical protein
MRSRHRFRRMWRLILAQSRSLNLRRSTATSSVADSQEGTPMPAKPPNTGAELTNFEQWMPSDPVPETVTVDRHIIK